jgi:3-hydroxyisobutyrate dehydrogenase-like beta-hydroxyacid dehydrogenase
MSDKTTSKIGVVGVGRMGANMARRLVDQGFQVTVVYDVRRESATELAKELKCDAPEKLADVTAKADIILTVVTDDKAMRDVFTAPGDNLLIGAKGRTFIDFATVSPQVHHDVEAAAHKAGAAAIEACMASSITQARQGTLYLILAGDSAVVEKTGPLLEALSIARRYVGPTGRAAQVKALVNMVMNINTAGLAEGLAIGDALGIDLNVLREIFSQTGANSRVLETEGFGHCRLARQGSRHPGSAGRGESGAIQADDRKRSWRTRQIRRCRVDLQGSREEIIANRLTPSPLTSSTYQDLLSRSLRFFRAGESHPSTHWETC